MSRLSERLLAERAERLAAYEATLEREPEDEDDMDWTELARHQHNDLTRGGGVLDGVRISDGGVVRGVRLA